MKLGALYSGGKDSTFAVYDSMKRGHEVRMLLTMLTKNPESYMFHYPNIRFTQYQGDAMGIPVIFQETKGEKEKELKDLEKGIKRIGGIDGLIAGGLASQYQYNRIGAIAEHMGLEMIVPYWKIDPEKYWRLILDSGFKVMIVGVACEGLGKEWLGRVIDEQSFSELRKLSEKHRFHLAFEGGEAETFVIDGPVFNKSIDVRDAETVWNRDSGFYLFKSMALEKKE